jgi:hypothetical protein
MESQLIESRLIESRLIESRLSNRIAPCQCLFLCLFHFSGSGG